MAKLNFNSHLPLHLCSLIKVTSVSDLKARLDYCEDPGKGPSLYHVKVFWPFLNHPLPYKRKFYVHNVRENLNFLNHPPHLYVVR